MYTPPARATLENQLITAMEGELGTTTPLFKASFIRVLAKALSGVFWLLHQLVAWAMKQIFPQFMDAEYLAHLADWYNLPRKPATTAILAVTITGIDGTMLDSGTLVTTGDVVFVTRSQITIDAGTAPVEVEALAAGTTGNIEVGTELSLPSPVAGVTSIVVSSVSVEAEDEEILDDWRARIVQRMQTPPQGGATGDYIGWACEVSGIVAAFVKRSGSDVFVYPLAAKTGSARIPDSAKIAEVQDYLQDPIRRPLCATVYAYPATERTVSVVVTGVVPADANTKASIVADVEDYIYAAYPKQYSDEPYPKNVISIAGVWSIIIANGATATDVSLTVSGIGAGVTSYTLPVGEIAAPGGITWA